MSESANPLADETINHVFILREHIGEKKSFPIDIYAHEGLLVRSESGKHRIYERWADGCDFTDAPSPASEENTQTRTTLLGNKTEIYKANKRVFDKQIHGQKVEKAVTFGDLNKFSSSNRDFNKDYQFASNNCQDYQEKVRSELFGLPVHTSLRTAITKNVVKLIASPHTRRHVSDQSSGSAFAASGSLGEASDSDGFHGINLNSTTLPSGHGTSVYGRVSTISPENQAFDLDGVIDGSLPSLFAEKPPLFSSYNASSSSSSFARAQAQSDASAESETRRRAHQIQTHAPGLFGAAENVMNCFSQGQYFAGVWNTGALAWSCGVLFSTGGAVSIIIEAPPDLNGPPRVRLAVAGLVSLG